MRKGAWLALMAVISIALTACVSSDAERGDGMTTEEAKTEVVALYSSAKAVIATGDWKPRTFWGPCALNGGDGLVQWSLAAQVFVDLPEEPHVYGQEISERWSDLGLDPEAGPDATPSESSYLVSDPPKMTGVRADGGLTQISISPNVVFFRAQSRCVPGRLADLQAPQG